MGRVPLDAVDQDKGGSARTDRCRTANVVVRTPARLAVDKFNIKVRHDTLKHLGRIGDRTPGEDLGTDLIDCARKVLLLYGTISHDYHLFKILRRNLQGNPEVFYILGSNEGVILEANRTDDKFRPLRNRD